MCSVQLTYTLSLVRTFFYNSIEAEIKKRVHVGRKYEHETSKNKKIVVSEKLVKFVDR